MTDHNSLRAQLEEQRCLIENQQVQIDRLKRHLEVQFRHTAHIQTQLDILLPRIVPSTVRPEPQNRDSGGGDGGGSSENGNGQPATT